jgi:hypothetical protein
MTAGGADRHRFQLSGPSVRQPVLFGAAGLVMKREAISRPEELERHVR